VCAKATEGTIATLACPEGQEIRELSFVSYGTPTGDCGGFQAGDCSASNARLLVEQACVGKGACMVPAEAATFGEPCGGSGKTLALQAQCAPHPQLNPLLWYSFEADLGGGTVADASGHGRDGLLQDGPGVVLESDRTGFGSALRLSGGEEHVVVPELGTTADLSLSLWINMRTLRQAQTTLYQAGNVLLALANSGLDPTMRRAVLIFRVDGNEGGNYGADTVSSAFSRFNEHENVMYDELDSWQSHPYSHMWLHLAVTYSAATRHATFYINGRRDSDHTFTVANPAQLSSGHLGAGLQGGSSAQGLFDDFSVYDRVLAADEVRDMGDVMKDLWAVRDADGWEAPTHTLYVDGGSGDDANSGTLDRPVKTLARGLSLVTTEGTRLVIAPGLYREGSLKLTQGGSRYRPVIIEGTPGKTVISGAESLTGGWAAQADGSWRRTWPYRFGVGTAKPNEPELVNRRELVTMNGRVLRQVLATDALENDTFWVDEAAGIIQLRSATDPRTADVEAANLQQVLAVAGDYVILRGLQIEMTNPYFGGSIVELGKSEHLLVEDCAVLRTNGTTLSARKAEDVVIRRFRGVDAGSAGLSAGFGNRNVLVEDSDFERNGWRARWGGYHAADPSSIAKNMFVNNVEYRRVNVRDHYIMGFWFDNGNWYMRLEDSYVQGRADQWNASAVWDEINPQGIDFLNTTFVNSRLVLANSEASTLQGCVFQGPEMLGSWEGGEDRSSGYVAGPPMHTHDHRLFGNYVVNPQPGGRVVGWPGWPDVLGTLESSGNRYWVPSPTKPFKAGVTMSWADWQSAVSGDDSSVFLADNPFLGAPEIGFGSRGSAAHRSKVPLILPVYLSKPTDASVTVEVTLVPGSAAAEDIVLWTPTLQFGPPQRMRAVQLSVLRSDPGNPTELTLELRNPSGASLGIVSQYHLVLQ